MNSGAGVAVHRELAGDGGARGGGGSGEDGDGAGQGVIGDDRVGASAI